MTRVDGDRENPEISNCLGVFGLNFHTTERDLEKEFSKFGTLEKVQVVLDGPSKRSRGFAFIYFVDSDDATRARDAMNGTEISGFKIRVDYSITKQPHKPTPGVYFHHGHATRPGFRGGRGERGGRGGFERRGGYEGRGRGGYERGYRSRGSGRGGYHGPYGERERGYYPRERPPGYERSYEPRYYDKYDRYERDYERPPPPHYKEREYRDERYYKDRYYEDRERYYKEREYRDYDREKYYDKYERYERERYEPRHYEKYAEPPRHYGHSSRRSPSPRPPPPRPRDY